jgi:hypothetical protein
MIVGAGGPGNRQVRDLPHTPRVLRTGTVRAPRRRTIENPIGDRMLPLLSS